MTRLLEVLLFVTPILAFLAWRLLAPSPSPPRWLIGSLAGFLVLVLLALVWVRHFDAGDATQRYVPAELRDGRIVPGHPAPPS